jgi:hypothetical protein
MKWALQVKVSMEAFVQYIKSLPKEVALDLVCGTLIPLVHEIGKANDIKLLDNTTYRQRAMWQEVKAIWPDIVLNTKRTGWDARTDTLNDIEFKTVNDDMGKNKLKSSFMWDKQAEEVRRTQTLASDAFVLGRFEFEKVKTILVARDSATLVYVRSCMEKEQAAFLTRWNANVAAGKRGGSDAIRLNYEKLLDSEFIWDLWIDGTWHMKKTASECRALLY